MVSSRDGSGRAVAAGTQLVRQVAVEVCESLEETLRVPQPHPREAGGVFGQRAQAVGEHRRGAVQVPDGEVVRILVLPFQAALVAKHPDAQAVVVPGGGHARPQPGGHSPGQLHLHGGVVEDAAAGHQGVQPAGQSVRVQSRDVAQQVVGVGPEVPHNAREPGNPRIGAPPCLLVALQFERRGCPPGGVLDVGERHRAQLTVPDHPGRVPDHRVRGIAVRDRQEDALLGGEAHQFGSGVRILGQRLLAHHRNAGLKEAAGDLEMAVVGRGDDHDVGPVRPGSLRCCHFRVVTVGPVLRNAQLSGQRQGTPPVPAEDARRQFELVVQPHGVAVGLADVRPGPAPDHSCAQPACTRFTHAIPFDFGQLLDRSIMEWEGGASQPLMLSWDREEKQHGQFARLRRTSRAGPPFGTSPSGPGSPSRLCPWCWADRPA